jgi:hypothetical protein
MQHLPLQLITAWILPHLDYVSHGHLRLVCREYARLPLPPPCAESRYRAYSTLSKRLFDLGDEQGSDVPINHSVYYQEPATKAWVRFMSYESQEPEDGRPGSKVVSWAVWTRWGSKGPRSAMRGHFEEEMARWPRMEYFEDPIAVRLHASLGAEALARVMFGVERQIQML